MIASWFSMNEKSMKPRVICRRVGWSSRGAFEQNLRRGGVKWSCARKINHPNQERECRNGGDEHPMAPGEIQILAQVKRALG